eukprot:1653463-Pleurochrysis_carterae.AAC.1
MHGLHCVLSHCAASSLKPDGQNLAPYAKATDDRRCGSRRVSYSTHSQRIASSQTACEWRADDLKQANTGSDTARTAGKRESAGKRERNMPQHSTSAITNFMRV